MECLTMWMTKIVHGKKIVTCVAMTQLVGIQSLWIPMWQVIMIRHKKWQLEDLD
jgi:hypothetical protein